jgi:hypothetical protein
MNTLIDGIRADYQGTEDREPYDSMSRTCIIRDVGLLLAHIDKLQDVANAARVYHSAYDTLTDALRKLDMPDTP